MPFMCVIKTKLLRGDFTPSTKGKCFKCDGSGLHPKCLVGYHLYLQHINQQNEEEELHSEKN